MEAEKIRWDGRDNADANSRRKRFKFCPQPDGPTTSKADSKLLKSPSSKAKKGEDADSRRSSKDSGKADSKLCKTPGTEDSKDDKGQKRKQTFEESIDIDLLKLAETSVKTKKSKSTLKNKKTECVDKTSKDKEEDKQQAEDEVQITSKIKKQKSTTNDKKTECSDKTNNDGDDKQRADDKEQIIEIASDRESLLNDKQKTVVNLLTRDIERLQCYIDDIDEITLEEVIKLVYDNSLLDASLFLNLKTHLFGATDVIGAILPRRKTTEIPLRKIHIESKNKNSVISEKQYKKIVKQEDGLKRQNCSARLPQWSVYGNMFERSTRDIINRMFRQEFLAFASGTLIWDLGNCLSSTPDYLLIETEANPLSQKLRQLPSFKNKKMPVVLQCEKTDDEEEAYSNNDDTDALSRNKIITLNDDTRVELVKPSTDKMTFSKLKRAGLIGVGECKTSLMNEQKLEAYREQLSKFKDEIDLVDLFESTMTATMTDLFIYKDTKQRAKTLPRVDSRLTKELNDCFKRSSWSLYDWESKKLITLKSNERCQLKLFRQGLGPQVLNEMISVTDLITTSEDVTLLIVLTSIIDTSAPANDDSDDKKTTMEDGTSEECSTSEDVAESQSDKSIKYQGVFTLFNNVKVPKGTLRQLQDKVVATHVEDYKSYFE